MEYGTMKVSPGGQLTELSFARTPILVSTLIRE